MSGLTDFLLARIAEDEYHYQITRVNPSRHLAECEAKRRIVARCNPEARTSAQLVATASLASDVIASLALPYADHPDYREEWKP